MSKDIVVVVPQQGFHGMSLSSIKGSILEHAGGRLKIAAPLRGVVRGSGGAYAEAHLTIEELSADQVAALVIIDGPDHWLAGDPSLVALLQALDGAGRVICAVGHGVAALAAAGILRGRRVAVDDEVAETVRDLGGVPVLEPLVSAGNLVTATEQGAARLAVELFAFRHDAGAQANP